MKMRDIIFLFMLLVSPILLFAQQSCWTTIENTTQIQNKLNQTSHNIDNYHSYHLNEQELRSLLTNVPERELYGAKRASQAIHFPTTNGTTTAYEIVELQTLSKELAAKYPNLKTYSGTAVNDPTKRIRIALDSKKIKAVLFDQNSGVYSLNPLDGSSDYILYKKEDDSNYRQHEFSCKAKAKSFGEKYVNKNQKRLINDGKLRTYRMAIATTFEYSEFHVNRENLQLGTVAQRKEAVLSAIMTTMMTINEIFENEFSITMQLVANMDQIIYVDEANTPFTGNFDTDLLLDESQMIIDDVIGFSNYDIGHTFSTGSGGKAFVGSPCTGQRATATTGISEPIGAEFDLDFVAHEMGHQFGANHVQNNDDQRFSTTAVEPGSGSTIMGYAGISFPNIQDDSDSYFNATSIREIWDFLQTVNPGGNCGVIETNSGNTAPSIEPVATEYTIPHSTPFVLDAQASDPDNDTLTYCWEQQDNETGPIMPPESNSTVGPMFRSLIPTRTTERYFPPYPQILAGELKTEWQVVPNVARELNFTLTVRDNNSAGGQNAMTDVRVSVANSGPFRITSQNDPAISYDRREIIDISWEVANTTGNGINTDRVDILLSYDGGQTFTEELITNTRNDGSERAALPVANFSNNCRIKIVPTNNIYFAINTVDFIINERIATNEPDTGTIAISPNPTEDGIFSVDFGQKIAPSKTVDIAVFDLSGKQIFSDTFVDTSAAVIDISYSAFGLYLIRIIRGNEIVTRKIYSKTQ